MTDIIQVQINNIILVGNWSWNHYNQECAICLTELDESKEDIENISIGTCLHAFHKKCLNTWLSRNNKCPICKTVWKYNK